jgi:hypothetical protein
MAYYLYAKECVMTLLTEPIMTAETADRYEVIDPAAVRAYLASRSALASVLEDAPQQIARIFPNASLRLETHTDPDDGSETLVLLIGTTLEANTAIDHLTVLDEAWWLDMPRAVRQALLITLGDA